MKYPHGTNAAYVLDECRCDECRAAAMRKQRERNQKVEPAFVSATPAREHLQRLKLAGIGEVNAARLAGVSEGCVRGILHGAPAKGKPPSKRISRENSERILAVKTSVGADNGRVDAAETHRMLEEIHSNSILPREKIIEAAGIKSGRIGDKVVSRATARKMKAYYDQWKVDHRLTNPFNGVNFTVFDEFTAALEQRRERNWAANAACRNRPTYVWFPAPDDQKCEAQAKKICASCVVRGTCLEENLAQQFGVFGGLNARERQVVLNSRRNEERVPV